MKKKDFSDFYQKNWPLIVKLLKVDKTHCIHHGFYEKGIHSHIKSVLNMNDFVGRLLKLDSKNNKINQVLDAGCGIGGTIIHLAKKYPKINFFGITIVPTHVEIARNLAKENQVENNSNFFLKDFTKTSFSSNQFTVPSGSAGKYFLFAQLAFTTATDFDFLGLKIFKNGSQLNDGSPTANFNQSATQIEWIETLAEGDYVDIRIYHNRGSSIDIYSGRTWFGGYLLTT